MNSILVLGTTSVMALMTPGLARSSSIALTPLDTAMASTVTRPDGWKDTQARPLLAGVNAVVALASRSAACFWASPVPKGSERAGGEDGGMRPQLSALCFQHSRVPAHHRLEASTPLREGSLSAPPTPLSIRNDAKQQAAHWASLPQRIWMLFSASPPPMIGYLPAENPSTTSPAAHCTDSRLPREGPMPASWYR